MTAAGFVVDASVVVEYLVELRLATQATKLFRTLQMDPELELWAPDLVYIEATSALRKLVRSKAITRSAGERCVDKLLRLPLSVAKSQPLIAEAYEVGDAVTVYDAIYAVLATRLSCELVTSDAKLARALRARRQRVLLLSELS
jgi:predicted nucleic acid-binding protein